VKGGEGESEVITLGSQRVGEEWATPEKGTRLGVSGLEQEKGRANDTRKSDKGDQEREWEEFSLSSPEIKESDRRGEGRHPIELPRKVRAPQSMEGARSREGAKKPHIRAKKGRRR